MSNKNVSLPRNYSLAEPLFFPFSLFLGSLLWLQLESNVKLAVEQRLAELTTRLDRQNRQSGSIVRIYNAVR